MVERVASFKSRLEKAMEVRDKRAIDIVKATGISESAMSQYRKGMIEPKREKLMAIAEYLRVDPSWLMGLDVPMEQKTASDLIYYQNKETAELVQRLFEDSNYRLLFDAAKDSKPEDIQMAADMLQRLKRTNPDG